MAYTIPESISWKNLDSGMVLLNLVDGAYYTLNETASIIFQNIIDGKTEKDIVSAILEEYDCKEEQAVSDVEEQITFLVNEGLLNNN